MAGSIRIRSRPRRRAARVYDMLADERMTVQAYHFPFPAYGRIERDGNGYRFVPA